MGYYKHIYWPRMRHDVHNECERCIACREANSKSMNFVLGLRQSKRGKDNIFVLVYGFSKMTHFIVCNKTNDAKHVTDLFFKDLVKLHGILRSIVSNRDVKILSHF